MTTLFSSEYISPQVISQMKPGFIVRPLQDTDFEKGFLNTLGMLTTVGPISKKDFLGIFFLI
jgi:glucosamine-phosphate N-acetyltransferase